MPLSPAFSWDSSVSDVNAVPFGTETGDCRSVPARISLPAWCSPILTLAPTPMASSLFFPTGMSLSTVSATSRAPAASLSGREKTVAIGTSDLSEAAAFKYLPSPSPARLVDSSSLPCSSAIFKVRHGLTFRNLEPTHAASPATRLDGGWFVRGLSPVV